MFNNYKNFTHCVTLNVQSSPVIDINLILGCSKSRFTGNKTWVDCQKPKLVSEEFAYWFACGTRPYNRMFMCWNKVPVVFHFVNQRCVIALHYSLYPPLSNVTNSVGYSPFVGLRWRDKTDLLERRDIFLGQCNIETNVS